MSSANPSNPLPASVRKRIAAFERVASSPTFTKPGRYHATICTPSSCAASTNAATPCLSANGNERLKFDVSRYNVRTPFAAMPATAAAGSAHAASS